MPDTIIILTLNKLELIEEKRSNGEPVRINSCFQFKNKYTMRETLVVNNIKCGGCETTVKDSLAKIEGIDNVIADSGTGEVTFDFSNKDALESARVKLHKLGYTETDPDLFDTAKSYVSCMIGKIKQ